MLRILPHCDERLDFAAAALDVEMILPQADIAKIQTLLAIGATHRPGVADFPAFFRTNHCISIGFALTFRDVDGKCAVDSIGKGSVR